MNFLVSPGGRQVLVLDLAEGISREARALLTESDLAFIKLSRSMGKEKVLITLCDHWPCESSESIN